MIDDDEVRRHPLEVRRLILSSGKIYVDLVTSPLRAQNAGVAVCRLEQLYPFPEDDVKFLMKSYPNLEEVAWVQEEPRNMGAWEFLRLQLARLIDGRWPLHYIGRPRSSSPAEGSSAWHALNQELVVKQAYDLAQVRSEESVLLRKA